MGHRLGKNLRELADVHAVRVFYLDRYMAQEIDKHYGKQEGAGVFCGYYWHVDPSSGHEQLSFREASELSFRQATEAALELHSGPYRSRSSALLAGLRANMVFGRPVPLSILPTAGLKEM